MCILIHTAHKKDLTRDELQTAMRRNSSGFFIAELLKNAERNIIRTLSSIDAQRFWDGINDDSEVVMHFRIPSKGPVSLNNVHGWSDKGILFAHNRTLTTLFPLMEEDKWEGTDSEYFFRHIFMPMYCRNGRKSYRNGYMHPTIDHIIRAICGEENKFMFVMPDNRVLRYGNWEGDDPAREGFHASNKSYMGDSTTSCLSIDSKPSWGERIRKLLKWR